MGKTKSRGNGEGTIYYNENKKCWVGQRVIGIKPDGKPDRKTRYGKTRKEVKEKLDKLLIEVGTDTFVNKNTILFKDLTKQFIEDSYRLNKLGDASYNRKLGTYNEICEHYMSNMEIQKITEYDVKEFLVYITKYSNSVIGKIYGLVNNTFKRAVRKNIIKNNFLDDKLEFAKPKSSKKDKDVRGFTVEEHKKFLDIVTDPNNPFLYKYQFLLEITTGMRMRRNKFS